MFGNKKKKVIGNHTRKKLTFVAKSGRKQRRIPVVIPKRKSKSTPFIEAFSFLTSGQSSSGLSSTVFQPTIDSELLLSYKEKRIELSKSWRQIEPKLLNIGSQYFFPASFVCCVCNCKDPNIIRCLDCGPNVYYCSNCVEDKHTHSVFHRPDIWKETIFVKLQLMQKVLKRIDVHECSFHVRNLTVIDGKGFHHELCIEFCQCESEAETLLRHNFWPCSVAAPKVAVSTELLEMLRVLSMEKQISTEGFCNALNNRYIKIPGYCPKIKKLSKILLNEVMESYRHHIYQLSHLSHLKIPGIDDGSSCPSCEGIPGDKMFCLDGNFGLVRRVAAGPQSIEPHHKNLFFADQQNVDDFVANYDDPKIGEDCSNFQAGSTIRSKGKNKKLDIKGVFGACCKHEIPKIFLDLKHGEKLGYPIWLIKHLLQSRNTSKLKIFYDIACRLKKHLMIKKDSVLLSQVAYAVPVFHGYGHNFACQMKFNPRRKVGFGLTEGETVERLWSYLRNCNKITKEMKPEHRTDFLTDSLLHYTQRIKQKIGTYLKQKMIKATAILNDSLETLKPLQFIPSDIMNDQLTHEHEQIANEKYSWEEDYCMKLYTLHQKRKTLNSMEENSNENVVDQFGEVARQEKKIMQFEKKRGISERWTDIELQKYIQSGVYKFRKTLLFKIQKANFERLFCSTLIKKYPAGQTVAKRIFANQNRMNKSIKNMISRYNLWHNIDGSINLPSKITWQEMLMGKYTSTSVADLQSATSLQVITDAYNLSLRAKEEILFTKEEMMSTMVFYQQQVSILNKWQSEVSKYARAQLLTHQLQLELRLKALHRDFQQFVKVTITTPLCDGIGCELQSENTGEVLDLEHDAEEMDDGVGEEDYEDSDEETSLDQNS